MVLLCAVAWLPAQQTRIVNENGALIDELRWVETLKMGQAIEIDNPYGDVRLRFGGFEQKFELQGVSQRRSSETAMFVVEPIADGDTMRVRVALADSAELAAQQRVDLVFFVAEGHPVTVRTTAGLAEARGIRAGVTLSTEQGDIAVRGITGPLNLTTRSGAIEGSLEAATVEQSMTTQTGSITLSFAPDANATLQMATSGLFATEYSLNITPQSGAEPNKTAVAQIGEGGPLLNVASKRGDIRLLRRASFVATSTTPEGGKL